jgi:hypothetical protein
MCVWGGGVRGGEVGRIDGEAAARSEGILGVRWWEARACGRREV